MKIILHYQETDSCTYFISSIACLDYPSLEDAYVHLSDLYNSSMAESNLIKNSDDYNYAQVMLNEKENLCVPLSDLDPDMKLETIEDYIKNLSPIKVETPQYA